VGYLRSLGGTPKGFLGVLPQNLRVYSPRFLPHKKQHNKKQQTRNKRTRNNKQAVAVVVHLLSAFSFKSSDSQALAEEALEAGLTRRAWRRG
jgi:hypothetical protein